MDRHLSEMKLEWDKRAAEEAKWYINTLSRHQTDEEFDASGRVEVERLVLSELALLTGGRQAKDLRLLEIGCGIGRMTRHLAGIFGAVYGVDVSAEMIRQAQARLQGLANVSLFETNGVDFALFPEAFFDLAFSAYVFQHIPSAEIIASNIVDALRVLKPGGLFKFVVNAMSDEAFLQSQKDSWIGDAFPEQRLRRLALETKAQLIGLVGAETQYCWVLLRRRQTSRPPARRQAAPEIILCGHADRLDAPVVQLDSERPYLTLVLAGEFTEWDDANSVIVQIGEQQLRPGYVGALGSNVVEFLSAQAGLPEKNLWQINVKVAGALPGGKTDVFVRFFDSTISNVCSIELKESREQKG
jgi:ubiquinone/menaquinone biosynthesis C-methylase UbiE